MVPILGNRSKSLRGGGGHLRPWYVWSRKTPRAEHKKAVRGCVRARGQRHECFSAFLAGFARTFTSLPCPGACSSHYPAFMSIQLIVAGLIGVFLLFYLIYSIVRPDRF